jgi:VanZ family protein
MRFSILLLIIITVLSLMPGQEFPETDMSFADKWVHWFMYGTWTVVVLWETRKRKTAHPLGRTVLLLFFVAAWSGLMELAQAFLTTTRSGEWMDLWANVFGVICGWALFGGWSAARSRKA